ncbi:MAG: hypothetical protein HGA61_02625, partial [Candidatus Moranbacteria bacterium]|nr:hypothetical protein [Candidatus Moranbacteria bacterium]
QLGPFFNLKIKLKDYPSTLYNFEPAKKHLERQKLIRRVIEKKLEKLFGKNYRKELNVNLDGKLVLNIADHHQVINHPILLAANIISGFNKILSTEKAEAIVVISSGDVPPNNFFSKKGFTFHDKRILLFNNAERDWCSYYIPKRDFDFVGMLKKADTWKDFTADEKAFLINECEEIRNYDFSKCENYIDQISVIVRNSWPRMFEKKLRANLPELIYLTQEEIVTECLIELLEDEDNIVSKAIFDRNFRSRVLKNFRGNVVTWNETEKKGTHFFWRKYPNQSRSLRMYLQDDKLVPEDERFKDLTVSLDKKEVIDLLKKREIYPSLFTIFGVLNFYAGVKPLVGYGSLMYLHLMKVAWLKTLDEAGMNEEKELLETVQTNGFIAGLSVAFKKSNNSIKNLYAYDIICDGGLTKEYLENVFSRPYADFLSICAVDMYEYTAKKYIPNTISIKPTITGDDMASLNFKWIKE